ncbi:hypothetical protein G6F57_005212 [Rhizopus arrhizus]|nr:hypothetical protein G6F21_005872 [Rhizopus arrhizus]KAG1424344.1 hypothetical protein G6F58_002428 [Rhizopus delemar]KAG0790538.1 hypothetical protein G6F22_006381 [Rhizopus arrhizus]KAG0811702.1 hypothetical protein G6F20_006958 [Rhizopus arrhizus]KAG0830690.1 hypothetical protein G6F19_007116 [Rhizopus arrhizus]
MFDQQQQRQQQKPNFKFVIRSKVETNINQEPATVEEKKQIEVKQVLLEDDRKRKRAAVEATMTSSKKIHNQLERWNKKHKELKDDKEIEEQAKQHYADLTNMACILCQRKFKSKLELEKHQSLSELHKNNLNDPVAVNKAMLKLNFSKTEPTEEPETKYRNRAAERRQAYGQPEKPVLSPPSSPLRHTNSHREMPPVPSASLHKPISDDNKGAQMLLNMGWRKGEGLGRHGSGILDPVKAESYGNNAGIGATAKYTVNPDASYKERTVGVHGTLYKIFPCALATSLDIGLSNLSLKTITLSFYTMCKSSTLAFVLIFAFLFKLEKPSWRLVLIIVIITLGVVLMVSDETDFALVGFVEVMSAAAFGGLRWSLTEVLLRKESMGLTNPFASIFFLAPSQAIILLTISGFVEGYITIFKSAFFISFAEGLRTIGVILAGGSLAFCMIVSEFFLIKRTSVVTLSVCGIFKEVATIFISSLVFGDVLTFVNIVGLCITLFGIGLYNWLKLKMSSTATNHEPVENKMENNHQIYNNVAESTPMLIVDSGDYYRESDDDDNDEEHNRFEMH